MALYEPNIYYLERHCFELCDYNWFAKPVLVNGLMECLVLVVRKEYYYMVNINAFEVHGNNPEVQFAGKTAQEALSITIERYNNMIDKHNLKLHKINTETIEAII